jgi:hypothetical protein
VGSRESALCDIYSLLRDDLDEAESAHLSASRGRIKIVKTLEMENVLCTGRKSNTESIDSNYY